MVTPKKRSELDIVLHYLSIGFTKQKIRKELKLKPSALANRLRRLEDLGCIERKGKYIINVLRSSHINPRVTRNKVHKSFNKRGHAHNFKIYFPKETDLKQKPKVKTEEKLKQLEKLSFGSLKFIKKKFTIWINKDTLTIYSNNSYYSDNALHSKFQAIKDVDNLVQELKDRFDFKGKYGIEVFREHYGLIFNKFANWLLKQKKKLYVQDMKGKTILWVDDSRKDDVGLKEFEAHDPLKVNNADTFFKSHDDTNWKNDAHVVEKNTKDIQDHDKVISNSMTILKGYAEQIALHLHVEKKQLTNLDKQDLHFQEQTKILGEIRDYLKNVNK
jgi:hypothetical protein